MTIIDNCKGAIFDLDGVLIDSGPAHKQSWFELAHMQGYHITDEIFYSTFGMQNPAILTLLEGREPPAEKVAALAAWKEKRYRDIIADTLELAAGGYELLRKLRKDGFRLAIGSSAPKENLDLAVTKLGLEKYFDAFVCSADAPRSKPAPDTFLTAARKIGLAPKRCVVVEDSVAGISAGKAAGMKVIALTTTNSRDKLTQADVIVNNLSDLTTADFTKLL
jgi:HAD superfamily hydrolase (TIGR01509 family)